MHLRVLVGTELQRKHHQRCATNDYCGCSSADALFHQRKAMCCRRCKTVMYPRDEGSPENHRKGTCSDGVAAKFRDIQWPQPANIFTNPKNKLYFHPLHFLQYVQVLYHEVVTESHRYEDLDLDMQALSNLLTSQMRHDVLGDGQVLFEIPRGIDVGNRESYGAFIIESDKKEYLRLDCLKDIQ